MLCTRNVDDLSPCKQLWSLNVAPKNLITENILLYIESIYYRLVEIAETRFGKAWQTIADGYWDQISQQAIKVHNLSAALRWD